MGKSVTRKIIDGHLVSGSFKAVEINKLKIDHNWLRGKL